MRTWKKANPSLAHFPWLLRSYRKRAASARINPDDLAAFRALRLNLGTADTAQSLLLEVDAWKRAERSDAMADGKYALGLDLGSTSAMSAAAAFWPETGRLECVAAFPSEQPLSERGLADGVGNRYVRMYERDELILSGTHTSSVTGLLAEVLARWGRPGVIACDRWRQGELLEALKLADFPLTSVSWRGMGFQDGGEDVRSFQRAVAEGDVKPETSLLMRSALSEARVAVDPAGNRKIAKSTEGGRRQLARDDAAVACVLAVAEGLRRSKRTRGGRKLRAVVVA